MRATHSIATVVDITHLKEAEAALRESELRLRLALDAAKMGTFEADIAANEAQIDEQEALLLGLPEGTRTISAAEMRKRIPLEDLDASDAKKERLTGHHEAYHHEFRLAMRDGSVRWLSTYADVRANRIFGVNFDITRRKLAEAELHESEARLRVATSGAALGVFEWDPMADRAVWENDRIYEIFGRSRADGPLGKREFIANFLHPDDAPELEATLTEAMSTGGRFHTICRINRKNGTRRWLQIDGRFEKAAPASATPSRRNGRHHGAQAVGGEGRKAVRPPSDHSRGGAEEHCPGIARLDSAASGRRQPHDDNPQIVPSRGEGQKSWDDLERALGEAMKELRTFSYLDAPAGPSHAKAYTSVSNTI